METASGWESVPGLAFRSVEMATFSAEHQKAIFSLRIQKSVFNAEVTLQ